MPKNPINYDNTFFYRIICKDINITDCYVGHTTNIIRRRARHKHSCNTATNIHHNLKIYQYIRENGGWDSWELIEIERKKCLDHEDASKQERYWLDFYKATLNCQIPSRTIKEYCIENKNKILEQKKQYYIENKEIKKEYRNQYYSDNKKKILEQKKQYYINKKQESNI